MPDGIRVKVDTRNLVARLRRIEKAEGTALSDAIGVAAELVRTEAVRSIQRGSRSGITYKRGSVFHRASAPGEQPKTDTGSLVSSIFSSLRKDRSRPVAFVGSDIVYAKHLEFGTRRMAARPWLQPAFDRMLPKMIGIIHAAFHKAARRR